MRARLRGSSSATRLRAEREEPSLPGVPELPLGSPDATTTTTTEFYAPGMTRELVQPAPSNNPYLAKARAKLAKKLKDAQDETDEIRSTWSELKVELAPAFEGIRRAQLGFSGSSNVFDIGDASRQNPIYKRKMEVLEMSVKQQATYLKAVRQAARMTTTSETGKRFLELIKDRKKNSAVMLECQQIQAGGDPDAKTFFGDVLLKAEEDGVSNNFSVLLGTIALILILAAVTCCLLPPVPVEDMD